MTDAPTLVFASATDVDNLIRKQILSNKLQLAMLDAQMLFSIEEKKLQDLFTDTAKRQVNIIKEMNDLLELQLTDFDQQRQLKAHTLQLELNRTKTESKERKDYQELNKKLADLQDLMQLYANQIMQLESTIPNRQEGTKYSVKTTDSSEPSPPE